MYAIGSQFPTAHNAHGSQRERQAEEKRPLDGNGKLPSQLMQAPVLPRRAYSVVIESDGPKRPRWGRFLVSPTHSRPKRKPPLGLAQRRLNALRRGMTPSAITSIIVGAV
jgi:hypothetical protein